jgi:hypothetical protein
MKVSFDATIKPSESKAPLSLLIKNKKNCSKNYLEKNTFE